MESSLTSALRAEIDALVEYSMLPTRMEPLIVITALDRMIKIIEGDEDE